MAVPVETQEEADERLELALQQALRWFQGDDSDVVVHRFEITVPDIAQIREALNLTQQALADLINVPVATLRIWEEGRRYPTGPARVLLNVLAHRPALILQAIEESQRAAAAAE